MSSVFFTFSEAVINKTKHTTTFKATLSPENLILLHANNEGTDRPV